MNGPPRAALDVGSNTVRVLVARPAGRGVQPVLEKGIFVRLGQGVDEIGRLNRERVDAALAAVGALVDDARSAGADAIHMVATSAVRDATDGLDFAAAVRRGTEIEVEILPERREGELTYLGATLGLSLPGDTIVADLGGRSTEIVAAGPAGPRWVQSLPLGSGRLMDGFIRRDPPRRSELSDLAGHVDDALRLAPRPRAHTLILTGGTSRQIPRILGLSPSGRRAAETDVYLDRFGIDEAAATACSMRAEKVSRRFGVRPERAAVLPAGLWALRQIARHYRPEVIVVTRRGLREGVLVESFRSDGIALAA
jgi:exopolyphosphatase/guanosine-5'-triphosphate,3'-diphosphate pyrophosphatase